MRGWIDPVDCPDFLATRGENAWVPDPDGWGITSPRFGSMRVRVQTNPDGSPAFERGAYREAANINGVAAGKAADGWRVLVVFQERPFSDLPSGEPADPPIVFGQPAVMAFNESGAETVIAAALRELLEEGGVPPEALIGEIVEMGHHNPNPTFCASWSSLFEVEVDLTQVRLPTDTEERITGTAWLPVREILSRIAAGELNGINYRSATANDTLMVWLARHPEAMLA